MTDALVLDCSSRPTIRTMYFLTRRMPENESAAERFAQDSARIMDLLDVRLADRDHIAVDAFTIADVMGLTWKRAGLEMIEAKYPTIHEPWPNVRRWNSSMLARPGLQRGIAVPADI